MSNSVGPGVKSFWLLVERGEQPNVADLSRRFPNEALFLAEAMRELARQKSAQTRERMWVARNRGLRTKGEMVSLGTLLKQKRISAGLSVEELARRLSAGTVRVASDAVRRLEDNALSPVAVKPPSLWRTLAGLLSIDSAQLMSFLTLAVQEHKTVQHFTRMDRGSVSEDRERFLNEASFIKNDQGAKYLEDVRRELDLPALGGHIRQ